MSTDPQRPAPKVVLIDDDADIRVMVTRILTDAGYRVASLGDPLQAVEFVRAEAPDIVVTDISMPELDGYGVVKALQQDPETARYPVLFLTANRDFTARVQAFRFGVVDYVTKPFSREVLLRKLERVLALREHRAGVLMGLGAEGVAALLRGAREEARSGVLSVAAEGGAERVVIRAGEVVESTRSLETAPGAQAEFRELDALREQILTHEPHPPPASARTLPDFADVPEPLRSVLVVDDDVEFRHFLRGVFAARGFQVHEAQDGEQALAVALTQLPWLILTDVAMPNVDGVELCRRVRQHSLIRHTPLVFLSGWDDFKERYRGLAAGGDEFLSKLSSVRELLIRVELIMKRYADLGRAQTGRSLAGEIDVLGAAGLLQMCHLSRLSGVCEVRSGERVFEARFRQGEFIGASSEGRAGEDAIFDFLAWSNGYFTFTSGEPAGDALRTGSFSQLLLEGCRRLDESARASVSD
jgi:DNA-binding response OmpR family regulator